MHTGYEDERTREENEIVERLISREEESEDILAEAYRLTSGDRQNQYGPPDQDFKRVADAWKALFGWDTSTEKVAMAMIVMKISRETHQKKRDNWTDMAGYTRCGWLCRQEQEKREENG